MTHRTNTVLTMQVVFVENFAKYRLQHIINETPPFVTNGNFAMYIQCGMRDSKEGVLCLYPVTGAMREEIDQAAL